MISANLREKPRSFFPISKRFSLYGTRLLTLHFTRHSHLALYLGRKHKRFHLRYSDLTDIADALSFSLSPFLLAPLSSRCLFSSPFKHRLPLSTPLLFRARLLLSNITPARNLTHTPLAITLDPRSSRYPHSIIRTRRRNARKNPSGHPTSPLAPFLPRLPSPSPSHRPTRAFICRRTCLPSSRQRARPRWRQTAEERRGEA